MGRCTLASSAGITGIPAVAPPITRELTERTDLNDLAVINLLNGQQCPPPMEHVKRCPQCSLNEPCNPELLNKKSGIKQLSVQLFIIETAEALNNFVIPHL